MRQGHVLVRVAASRVNGSDLTVRTGNLRLVTGRSFPRGAGFDFARTDADTAPRPPSRRAVRTHRLGLALARSERDVRQHAADLDVMTSLVLSFAPDAQPGLREGDRESSSTTIGRLLPPD
jgi:hypothetical protein